jgi:hypothetical protein
MHEPLLFKLDQNPGGVGLRCDPDGLFLGSAALLRRDRRGTFEARPAGELHEVLRRAYATDTNWESRVRSVTLVADALNKGEVPRAMIVAVLMRLPEPGSSIRIADVDGVLAKVGYDPDEPRDQRGRWTSGGSSTTGASTDHRPAGTQLADAGLSDVSTDPMAQAAVRATEAAPNPQPNIILAAADEEEESDPRFGIGGNHPPIEELIPQRLLQSPAGPPIQFLDNLLGISEPGDEANLEWAQLQMKGLLYQIRKIDPNYIYQSIEPAGGLAVMNWEERLNVINGLKADLDAAIYRVKGDIKPLQEVTFEFIQRATNAAYAEGVEQYNAGDLDVLLSREEAIGNYVDREVRAKLNSFFNGLNISTEPGSAVRINRRAYNSSESPATFRLPDSRVGNIAFDVTLEEKQPSKPQIKGFFAADFQPAGVVIIRPNQLGNPSSYILWRPKSGW